MAKNESKVEVTVETPEVKVEETAKEVVVIEPISKDKKVKVRLKASFRQYIGDKWYTFEAGKEILVPEFIKEMLQERGMLEVL